MEIKELESLDVLVVDDDALLREIYVTLLRELGVRRISEAKDVTTSAYVHDQPSELIQYVHKFKSGDIIDAT